MSNEKEWVDSAMNYDKACLIYEAKGQFAVHDAAKDGTLKVDHWGYCVPCEIESPIEGGCCLVCGTEYEEGQEPEADKEKEEMSLQEALRLAICTVYQAIDEVKQMSDYEKQFLQTSEDELIEVTRVLDEHMRTM
jgi:hypothetical protein